MFAAEKLIEVARKGYTITLPSYCSRSAYVL